MTCHLKEGDLEEEVSEISGGTVKVSLSSLFDGAMLPTAVVGDTAMEPDHLWSIVWVDVSTRGDVDVYSASAFNLVPYVVGDTVSENGSAWCVF